MTLRKLIEAVEAGALSAGSYPIETLPQYTEVRAAYRGSLDAAKALHDALLPGWEWWVSSRHYWDVEEGPIAFLRTGTAGVDLKVVQAKSPNPARAWLLAILRAMEAEGRE